MHHGHKVYHFCSSSPNSNIDISVTFCTLQAHRPDGSVAIAEYTLHAKKTTHIHHTTCLSVITIYLTSVIGSLSWILTYVHVQKKVSIHNTGHNAQIYTSIYLCWYQMMADSTMTTVRRTTTAATATPITAQAVVH